MRSPATTRPPTRPGLSAQLHLPLGPSCAAAPCPRPRPELIDLAGPGSALGPGPIKLAALLGPRSAQARRLTRNVSTSSDLKTANALDRCRFAWVAKCTSEAASLLFYSARRGPACPPRPRRVGRGPSQLAATPCASQASSGTNSAHGRRIRTFGWCADALPVPVLRAAHAYLILSYSSGGGHRRRRGVLGGDAARPGLLGCVRGVSARRDL